MGLAVAPDNTFALSCSAEHLVVKYLLLVRSCRLIRYDLLRRLADLCTSTG